MTTMLIDSPSEIDNPFEAQYSNVKNANQKGGKLIGGSLTREVLESSRSVLAADRAGNTRGLQSWFTPIDIAAFVRMVVNPISTYAVFDPTAGDGSLLAGFGRRMRYGCEVDEDSINRSQGDVFADDYDPNKTQEYTAMHGDIQRLFPLLHLSDARFAAIVANPPFGLTWNEAGKNPTPLINGGKPCSSTRWTWEACQKLLRDHGQGAFICGTRRLEQEILSDPHQAKRVYAIVDVPDLFPGVQLDCSITFFADPDGLKYHDAPRILRLSAHREAFTPELWKVLAKDITRHRDQFYTYLTGYDTITEQGFKEIFHTIQQEHKRRLRQDEGHKNAVYDVEIRNSKLHVYLSPLAETGLRREHGSDALQSVRSLHNQRINYFALNMKDWNRIKALEFKSVLTIDPKVAAQVQQVIDKAIAELCPVYPIKPQQRLGYLADAENITCTVTDEEKGFFEGESYPITTESEVKTNIRTEVKVNKRGDAEELCFQTDRKVLKITIDARQEHEKSGYDRSKMHIFRETKEDITYLLDHFDIPDPGDLATHFPAEMEDRRSTLRYIEQNILGKSEAGLARWPEGVKYKDFQVEDISRLLIKNGGILSWDMGGGKSAGSMGFAYACELRNETDGNALFIVPADLIPQWQREAMEFYGRELIQIKTRSQAREIAQSIKRDHKEVAAHNREEHRRRRDDRKYPMQLRKVKGNWYLANFETLAIVGLQVKKFKQLDRVSGGKFVTTDPYIETVDIALDNSKSIGRATLGIKGEQGMYAMPIVKAQYKIDKTTRKGHYNYEGRQWEPDQIVKTRRTLTTEEICPVCGADTGKGWDGVHCKQKEHSTGKKLGGCGYQHKRLHVKGIAHELTTAFSRGVVTCDEGTKIQGDFSLTSLAIRGIRARRKLLLTGTPVKSFVYQMYWLLSWALGSNTPKFPFAYYGGKYKFEQDFCVTEKLIGTSRKKILPDVTNLSVLWRMLSGSIVRRRKEDMGEPIVERKYSTVIVPMGKRQYKHFDTWLDKDNFVDFYCARKNPTAKREIVKMNSAIYGQYSKLNWSTTHPSGDRDADYFGIVPNDWTPKATEVMQIAARHAALGEKVLVGSDCLPVGKMIADELNKKGIKAEHILEGREDDPKTKGPAKRAAVVRAFQKGDTRVLCAGVQSINLGHNMDCASVVILDGLPWDFATLDQFLARVHRLTSKHPVTVYVVMTAGSMDERKWNLLLDKTASSELTLDGELQEKKEASISQQQVINEMAKRGVPVSAMKDEDGQIADEDACRAAWEKMTFDIKPLIMPVETVTKTDSKNKSLPVVSKSNNKRLKPGKLMASETQPTQAIKVEEFEGTYQLEFITHGGKALAFESRKIKPSMMTQAQETITDGLFAF